MAPCDSCGWMGRYAGPGNHPKAIRAREHDSGNNYTLYPNPNGGSFTLTPKEIDIQPVTVVAVDAVGGEVYNHELLFVDVKAEIGLNNLPSGVYLLSLTDSICNKIKIRFVISM